MHRLLIVDDEYHVVDWLVELFSQQSQVDLEIYKAYRAKEALEVLEKVKIDVVLSDIRMPGLDGFGLADRIRENWPDARIIFLTGYDDFDYAYRANKYQNITYLLKTEDDDVILMAVMQAIESLNAEQSNRRLVQEYVTIQNLVEYQIWQRIYREWIGRPERGMKSSIAKDMSPTLDRERGVLICAVQLEEEGQEYLEHEKCMLRLNVMLNQQLSGKACGFLMEMDRGNCLWLMQTEEETGRILLYLKEMLEEFAGGCLESCNCHAFFTLYYAQTAWKEVREKYELLRQFGAEQIAAGEEQYGGRFVDREAEERCMATQKQLFQEFRVKQLLEQMESSLENGKRDTYSKAFLQIYDMAVLAAGKHNYPVIGIYQRISAIFLSCINRRNLVEKLAFRVSLHKLYNIYDFNDWKEAFDYLREVGDCLFREKTAEQTDRNTEFVETVKGYIRGHLGGDLSLTAVAQAMNYNPSYVSRLFKQLSGQNLFDFINEERMALARKLLRESAETVQMIAEQTGFETSQYFSSVFKKQFGMTPGDFRHYDR